MLGVERDYCFEEIASGIPSLVGCNNGLQFRANFDVVEKVTGAGGTRCFDDLIPQAGVP